MRYPSLALVLSGLFLAAPAAAAPVHDPVRGIWTLGEPGLPVASALRPAGAPGSAPRPWSFDPFATVAPGVSESQLWADAVAETPDVFDVVWMDDRSGEYKIYFARTEDGGRTWSAAERVDDSSASAMCRFPSAAVDAAGNVYVAWEDDRTGAMNVYLSRRLGGPVASWRPSVKLNTAGSPPGLTYYMNASLAAQGDGVVYAAWTDWRDGAYHHVYTVHSLDRGATWSPEVRIDDAAGINPLAADPSLFADRFATPGTVYCAWNDWSGAGGARYPDVYFSFSADLGASWLAPNLRVNDLDAYYQEVGSRTVGVDRFGSVYVGWWSWDYVTLPQLRLSRARAAGRAFEPSTRVNDGTAEVGYPPALAADGEGILSAVWMDYRSGVTRAYFAASFDEGATWSAPSQPVDPDGAWTYQYLPTLAAAGGRASLVAAQVGTYEWLLASSRGQPEVGVSVRPDESPTVVPASGGSFGYTLGLTNRSASVQTVELRASARLPDGSTTPESQPRTVTLQPGQKLSRHLVQRVPASLPAGAFHYFVRADRGGAPLDREGFPVEKARP